MTPVILARLRDAYDFVCNEFTKQPDEEIVATLVADHRGFFRIGAVSLLRVAGIEVRCDQSDHGVLLDLWLHDATVQLHPEVCLG